MDEKVARNLEKGIEISSTCVQRANTLLNCLLSSKSMNECEEPYQTFRNCCSKHNIVNIKLEALELEEEAGQRK